MREERTDEENIDGGYGGMSAGVAGLCKGCAELGGTAKVNLKIPKFSFGSDLELTQVLEQMGLTDAFSETADFTPMTEEPVWISSVRQQSHMSLDEKGVEAASFTNIAYSGAAMPQPEVVDMILDRPFLYGIYCQNVLVFVGICQNPGE